MSHIPVLLNEVIEALDPKPGEFFIDGTFGNGGHSKAILEKIGITGKLLAIDWDQRSLILGKKQFGQKNIIWKNDNFAQLPKILKDGRLPRADGLLLDLGFSSEQLEESGRGFSFRRDEPLIMTYGDDSEPVSKLLSRISGPELTKIIRMFGEERFAERIGRAIIERQKSRQPIKTSKELAEIIERAVPKNYEHGRIHPATRTFQALRIYANQELDNLENVLKNLGQIIKPGGRTAIISFHSLEDRMVKNYFREYAKIGKMRILTKKPIKPGQEEIKKNYRSRSAKLRAAILINKT